jgi:hypothetical protein
MIRIIASHEHTLTPSNAAVRKALAPTPTPDFFSFFLDPFQ